MHKLNWANNYSGSKPKDRKKGKRKLPMPQLMSRCVGEEILKQIATDINVTTK
jgi:hypothetical protein